MGVLKRLGRICIDLGVILVLMVSLPGIPPKGSTYSPYTLAPQRPFEGPLSLNAKLDVGERLFEGRINGPESIASRRSEEIFVSLHGGKIMKIWGQNYDHSKIVASIGPGCAGPWEEEICGRPLGLRFAPNGKLYVADAYLGVFSLDVDTEEKVLLVDAKQPINGTLPLLIDDLDIDSEGDVYFSDASTLSDLANGFTELLSDPTGRLLKYSPSTNVVSLLLPNIHFANGVQLSPNQDFVLVCETFRARVLRYWLTGPKAGENDIFIDGLPGMPDNIRARPSGGYYVSLVSVSSPNNNFMRSLPSKPLLRKLLSRLLTLTKLGFDFIAQIVPNDYTAKIAYNILNLSPVSQLLGHNHSVIVELGPNGEIESSLQGLSGTINTISECHQIDDHLFFGSPWNNYLGHVSLTPDSEDQDLKKPIEKTTPKSVPSSSNKEEL